MENTNMGELVDERSGAAAIPVDQDVAPGHELSDRLVMLSRTGSTQAESISMLHSQLLSRHVHDYRRGIAFCSASDGTGCSYMAANIACAMAMSGIRTLLLDANLRDPEIDGYFTPREDRGGLLDCLGTDQRDPGSVVHREVIPNLSIIYSGGSSRESGLLSSTRFADIVGACMRDYELTIIDTPPANKSSDALRIANVLRYALIVARKDRSYVKDIRKLVDDLRVNRAEVLGTYLNDF
ncbi:diutan polysaccharide export protein [Erythrobacter sp. 3-20A1M]|uniref:CpsD/CapB family tyrosine-protein kinase n=1 Tax=Erythrobacter sp. 3-20A1M TaxID=2653850 RepID=UPI001BFC7222|nr:CpsD/CapB family tyrosine-protein kinase [Erythrobacter sp. 3-20A1M]QWC56603.1 diutan polysaccharide export protein [Erythrobacter sp. 3-20A1M]